MVHRYQRRDVRLIALTALLAITALLLAAAALIPSVNRAEVAGGLPVHVAGAGGVIPGDGQRDPDPRLTMPPRGSGAGDLGHRSGPAVADRGAGPDLTGAPTRLDDPNGGRWIDDVGAINPFGAGLLVRDSDGDGLADDREVALDTNPRSADTDGDELDDGDEVRLGTWPRFPDTDGDGLADGEEVAEFGTDPNEPDTDGDWLLDGDEIWLRGTDPTHLDDADDDCLPDGHEIARGTDRLRADTDGDGVPDGACG